MTPLPRDQEDCHANSPKLFFEYGFVNLTHLSVFDINDFTLIFTSPSIIIGFDIKLQPLASIIAIIFYEFQPGSMCPRMPKATLKGAQGYSKGNRRSLEEAEREPKGSPKSQNAPKVGPGAPKVPKEAKGI